STATERPSLAGDRVGEVLAGRYRVLRRLGAGGMGTVYLAEQVHLGRLTAVKVLCPPLCADDPGAFAQAAARAVTSGATLRRREYARSTGGLGIGRWHSRTLSGERLHDGGDGSIAAPRAVGAPVWPHARERHGDLSPSCRHPGGGRRGRRGRSRGAPALASDAGLVPGAGPPWQRGAENALRQGLAAGWSRFHGASLASLVLW